VIKDTAAEKAGIKAGDVITKVDGTNVTTPNELSSAVRGASAKKTFALELMRERAPMTVNVTVEDGRSERVIPPGRSIRNSVKL
jgi:serine protease Do/serine protease DegQ